MLVVSWIHPLSDTFDIFLIHPHSIFLLGDVIADHPVALLHTKPLSIETQQLSNNDDKSSVSKDSDTNPSTSANKNTASTTTKRRRNSKTSASREALRRSANDGSIEITFPPSVPSSSSMSSSSTAVTASPSTLYYTSDLMWAARDIESGQSSHYIMIVGGCTFNNKNRKTETVRCCLLSIRTSQTMT